jgi:uncharacterized SAM-binding protein YcdF (DUF218 family)
MKDAMEEKLNGLLITLLSTVLNNLLPILTLPETELANIILQVLFIPLPTILIFLLETVMIWPLPFKINLSPLLLMLVVYISNSTLEVFSINVEPNLTTLSFWLDTSTMELPDTGLPKTLGEIPGENKVTSISLSETLVDSVIRLVTETLSEFYKFEFKKLKKKKFIQREKKILLLIFIYIK